MSRPRKHATASARAAASRAEMLAKGWRPVQIWLSPEQMAALDGMGRDRSATIRRLIEGGGNG